MADNTKDNACANKYAQPGDDVFMPEYTGPRITLGAATDRPRSSQSDNRAAGPRSTSHNLNPTARQYTPNRAVTSIQAGSDLPPHTPTAPRAMRRPRVNLPGPNNSAPGALPSAPVGSNSKRLKSVGERLAAYQFAANDENFPDSAALNIHFDELREMYHNPGAAEAVRENRREARATRDAQNKEIHEKYQDLLRPAFEGADRLNQIRGNDGLSTPSAQETPFFRESLGIASDKTIQRESQWAPYPTSAELKAANSAPDHSLPPPVRANNEPAPGYDIHPLDRAYNSYGSTADIRRDELNPVTQELYRHIDDFADDKDEDALPRASLERDDKASNDNSEDQAPQPPTRPPRMRRYNRTGARHPPKPRRK